MKKLLVILLALTLVLAFAACGNSEEPAGEEQTPETEEVVNEEETAETDEEAAGTEADTESDVLTEAALNYFASFPDTRHVIDAESLIERVKAGEELFILDIRSAEDYAAGHIAGAINIPFGAGMQESFSQIPTDKPVIVYCYTGQTASQVLGVLRMLGYEAYNMSGGMTNGWLAAGYEVVTE